MWMWEWWILRRGRLRLAWAVIIGKTPPARTPQDLLAQMSIGYYVECEEEIHRLRGENEQLKRRLAQLTQGTPYRN